MAEDSRRGEENNLIPRPLMAESPNGASIVAAVNLKSDDSNQLKQSDRSACNSSSTKTTNTAEDTGNGIGNMSRSCKGCLYYSSRFKADSRNPLCVGLTRSLPNVPQQIVESYEAEASKEKEGRNMREFSYACIGYSLYEDRKGQAANGQQNKKEFPFCIGLEVLVDRRVETADSAPAHHVHNKGAGNELPHRKPTQPTNPGGKDFVTRFTRNANLVANGVAKNIRTLGNQIKQGFDFYRRPK